MMTLDKWFLNLGVEPREGVLLLDALSLKAIQLNPALHTFIINVNCLEAVAPVQKALLTYYPEEYQVSLLSMEDTTKWYQIPLRDLSNTRIEDTAVIFLKGTQEPSLVHRHFSKLIEIVEILRSPEGCPWDREQTHQSIRKNVIEEAYEVAEAIDLNDPEALSEELGDLLLQVALHAQMASEAGTFTVYDTIQAINDKLIRRHPHVFGDKQVNGAGEALQNWEEIKRQEKRDKGHPEQGSLLDSVSSSFPAMQVAYKLQKKAAEVGFEWPDVEGVLDKIHEEVEELRHTHDKTEELGDVLFVLVNLARYLKIDPEEALAKTNAKFRRRFAYVEKKLSEQGKSPLESSLEEMDKWWNEAKKVEKM